jgi:two-component sensor histidine kinase
MMKLIPWISMNIQKHKDQYDDYFEEAKFTLAFRISLFLTIALFVLSIVFISYFDFNFFLLTFFAFLVVFITFLRILITGKYKTFTAIFIIMGTIMCNFTLYFFPEYPHVMDSLWMVVTIALSFHLLSNKTSIFIALFNIFSITTFYVFFSNEQIKLLKEISFEQSVGLGINILVCMSIIVYLVYQNSKTTYYARLKIKESENQLKHQVYTINKQNEEKTILIKEIHHRVKNNLQVIISLLRLQSNELKNEEAIEKLQDTTNRVIAMARIHERMYKNDQLSKINLEEYFSSFAKELKESLEVQIDVALIVRCDLKDINLKAVVPLAIIMNELLTNSFKHAFNGCIDPFIKIEFIELTQGNFTLIYSDSGCWKYNLDEKSFGLELIELMTEQLGGMFEINQEQSTYTFKFENTDW